MVVLATQFPKPIIIESREDLPPARLKEAGPVAKGAKRWARCSLGAGRLVKGTWAAASPISDTKDFSPTHMLALIFFPKTMTWEVVGYESIAWACHPRALGPKPSSYFFLPAT